MPTEEDKAWWNWVELCCWEYECWREDPIWYNEFIKNGENEKKEEIY